MIFHICTQLKSYIFSVKGLEIVLAQCGVVNQRLKHGIGLD